MSVARIRSSAIVLDEPPVGKYVPGHCWWCGAELVDPEKAIQRGRHHCYKDREGRDCVGDRRRSVVWSARNAILALARRRDEKSLACVDCGLVVAEIRAPRRAWDHVAKWDADHEIPLEDGGPHTPDNFRVRCVPCHCDKTAREATARAERRRAAA